MALDLGALGLAAGRAVSGYGQGRLAGMEATAAQQEREAVRREQYAQRLHEIMLAHALSGRGAGAQPLSETSPELAAFLNKDQSGAPYGDIPMSAALSLYTARAGQTATGERQVAGEHFASGQTGERVQRAEHEATKAKAQRYAEGYASQHADEVKQNAGAVMGRIYTLLSSFYPTLSTQELYEVAGSAVETFKQPRAKTFNEIMAEQMSGADSSGYVPQGTVVPGTTHP